MPQWIDNALNKLSRHESRNSSSSRLSVPQSLSSWASRDGSRNNLLALFREQKFRYETLHSKADFRLLHLRRKADGRCEWSLELASIHVARSYTAISYTWGSTDVTSEITLSDGQKFPLTTTLSDILRAIERRAELQNASEMYIWIDAICINQADDREKAMQVEMMRHIYTNAANTIVWLGPSTPGSDLAMSAVNAVKSASGSFDGNNLIELWDYGSILLEANMRDVPLVEVLEGFYKIVERKWFTRVWVIQEVVSSSHIELLCGRNSIMWEDLYNVLMTNYGSADVPTPSLPDAARVGLGNAIYIQELRKTFDPAKKPSLSSVLWRGLTFDATDLRDKVYATLGLASERDQEAIRIDYSKPVDALFTEVALHILKTATDAHDFSVLSSAGIGLNRNLRNLPSWVSDWTNHPRPVNLGFASTIHRSSPFFQAAITVGSAVCDGPLNSSITIRGMVIDTIKHIGNLRPYLPQGPENITNDYVHENFVSVFSFLEECAELVSSVTPYVNGDPPDEILWKTIIANTSIVNRVAPEEYAEQFQNLYDIVRHIAAKDYTDAILYQWNCGQYRVIYQWFKQSRLFVTDNGYIGLGYDGMAVGDAVVLLLGASVPYVIREVMSLGLSHSHTPYQLVGECYIHGIMQGEGLALGEVDDIVLV